MTPSSNCRSRWRRQIHGDRLNKRDTEEKKPEHKKIIIMLKAYNIDAFILYALYNVHMYAALNLAITNITR